jgi:hypothetical protein
VFADTAFLNKAGRVRGVSLEHMGFGEFYANTPKGRVDFDRMRGKDFPGQSGRSHKVSGEGADWLVQEMSRGGHSDKVASARKAPTLKGRLAKLAFDNPDMRETLMPLLTKTAARPINQIAREIAKDWGSKVNYAAKPYLQAMFDIRDINDMYGSDTAKGIVLRFLGNAGSWRGPKAKEIKAELKKMVR